MKSKSSSTGFQKFAWSFGGIAENLSMNVLPTLVYNIFQIGMGISPFVIGIAMSASKFIEGFSDTLFGNLSDNTRSKYGRRRPWILVGAILVSLVFVAIWFTPRNINDVEILGIALTGKFLQSAYFVAVISLFYIVLAIWQMPFSALGLEMETDYAERTKLQTYKQIFSYLIGIVIGSLYLITQMKDVWGGDEVVGARHVGVIIGIIILFAGIVPALFCREHPNAEVQKQEKVPFWPSLIETFKCKPFILLMMSIFFIFVALFFMLPLLGYISMYHVCTDGMHTVLDWSWREPFTFAIVEKFVTHKELAGYLGFYTAVLQPATQIITVIIVNRVAGSFDKRTILISGASVAILGYISSWFLFTPSAHFLGVLPPVIINIGLAACWPLIGAFTADVCDYDELKTGTRREGMYSAVNGFLIKLAIALVTIIASAVLIWVGIEGANPIISVSNLITIRTLYIIFPTLAMLGTIFFIWKYPLTKSRVFEIQEELAIKRQSY
ncbi:MAG: MFS transporter [Bacteroidales bacterium]|nr:MFS transporter [Bacteroidales bacterium]NLK80645.1 MFS transporter [Bacteroidales bacterium]